MTAEEQTALPHDTRTWGAFVKAASKMARASAKRGLRNVVVRRGYRWATWALLVALAGSWTYPNEAAREAAGRLSFAFFGFLALDIFITGICGSLYHLMARRRAARRTHQETQR